MLSSLISALSCPFMCTSIWTGVVASALTCTSTFFSLQWPYQISTVFSSLYPFLLKNPQDMILFQISDRKFKLEFLQVYCLQSKLSTCCFSTTISLVSDTIISCPKWIFHLHSGLNSLLWLLGPVTSIIRSFLYFQLALLSFLSQFINMFRAT